MSKAKTTQFNHSVTHSSIQSDYGECATEAVALAEQFRKGGFVYKGRGSLEGLLSRKIREGYTTSDLMKAFEFFSDELSKRNNKKDHPAYYLSVLDSVFPYGPMTGMNK